MRFEQYITKEKLEEILSSKDLNFDISMLVTEARLHAGLTQGQLAKRMKTKQPSIARVESGRILPSLDFLDKLAKAIGTELIAPHFSFMENKNKDIQVIVPSPYFEVKATTASSGNTNKVKFN